MMVWCVLDHAGGRVRAVALSCDLSGDVALRGRPIIPPEQIRPPQRRAPKTKPKSLKLCLAIPIRRPPLDCRSKQTSNRMDRNPAQHLKEMLACSSVTSRRPISPLLGPADVRSVSPIGLLTLAVSNKSGTVNQIRNRVANNQSPPSQADYFKFAETNELPDGGLAYAESLSCVWYRQKNLLAFLTVAHRITSFATELQRFVRLLTR